MKTTQYLFFLCFLFSAFTTNAQTYPPPTGVFCSCGPTLDTGNGSVDPAVAAKTFVKGILVRVPWRLLEPTDNTFDWTLIDGQIAAANSFNKKISLGIENGPGVPKWLFDMGVPRIISTFPRTDTIATPWDSIYLAQWAQFVAALGAKYQNDTTIQLVYISNSTANGFEMQLPFQSTPTLVQAGYTDEKMTRSWKQCMDAFNGAFPNHYLTNDFHPVNNSNTVADSVYAYAIATIGNRYGANAWWWTQKNTVTYPAQYTISQHSAKNNQFTGVQFANSGTADSAKFGEGGMPVALQLAIDDGICYWEIWNQDILNPQFEDLLTNASCNTQTTATLQIQSNQNLVSVFPNPASSMLTIAFDYMGQSAIASICTLTGQKIISQKVISGTTVLDVSAIPNGVYIAEVENANSKTRIRCLVLH
jgi:hypothetical protein